MPDAGLKSLADAPLGRLPWRWMAKSGEHAHRLADKNADNRITALEPFLQGCPEEQRQKVNNAVRQAQHDFYKTGTWLDVLDNRLRLAGAAAIIAVTPVSVIVAFFIGPQLGWQQRAGAMLIALACTGAFFGAVLVTPEGGASELRFFTTLIPPVAVTATLATMPSWWGATPPWLRLDWVHFGLAAAAWSLSGVTLVCMAFYLIFRTNNILIPAAMRRRNPEQHFINALSYLVLELAYLDDKRSAFLEETEDAAQTIELFWPKRLHTRYPHLNADVTQLARQIGAAAREKQLNVSVGVVDPKDLLQWLTNLMAAVVSRDLEYFRPFEASVSLTAAKLVWWRRIGRGATALALLALTLILLVTAIWQPGLPDLLKRWGFEELGNVLTLNDEFRLALAGGAVAALRGLVALYSSAATGQSEATGLAFTKRKP